MPLHNLTRFPRLEFIGAPTPLEYLPRFSDYLGREIFIKRDDVTPMAMGGNKLRKLEFLAADALREGADTLLTAGAIQSNHVRQTAAVAAKLGLHCVALLENPIGTTAENYLSNGNRLLLDLFNTQIEMCDALSDPNAQLEELATRVEAQGFRPYVIPVGGSNALGALGYVESALEIAQQCEGAVNISSVVVASGSAGTHAGLAVGLEQLLPDTELIGVTVSRSVAEQLPKVVNLQQAIAKELELTASGNDACVALADYIAGGQRQFVDMMNNYAEKLHLQDTHFETVHGLDAPGQHSSAYDLAVLSRAIIHGEPDFYHMYSEKSLTWNGITQQNRNGLLWDKTMNVDGLKTGHTSGPRDYAELLESVADRPDAEMLQTMLLRSMKQAIYDPENRGHFGLALQSYAHFTSPIRRYPDLTLHRGIKYLLAKVHHNPRYPGMTPGGPPFRARPGGC